MIVAARRQPARLASFRNMALPGDLLTIIKLAAKDGPTVSEIAALKNDDPDLLCQAAQLSLREVITYAGHDAYRTLCLRNDAHPDLLKQHRRWLLKWLHPDVNTSRWEAALFQKVSTAADTLEKAASSPQPAPSSQPSRQKNARSSTPKTVPSKSTSLHGAAKKTKGNLSAQAKKATQRQHHETITRVRNFAIALVVLAVTAWIGIEYLYAWLVL
jgi:cobalamin biosynthesis Mg chelatase CobN